MLKNIKKNTYKMIQLKTFCRTFVPLITRLLTQPKITKKQQLNKKIYYYDYRYS